MLSRLSEWRVLNTWRYLFLFSISRPIRQEIYWLSYQNSPRTWLLLNSFPVSSLAQDTDLLAKILLIASWESSRIASWESPKSVNSPLWTIDLSSQNRKQVVSILGLACHAGQIPNPFYRSRSCELPTPTTTKFSSSSFLILASISVPLYLLQSNYPSLCLPQRHQACSQHEACKPAILGFKDAVQSLTTTPGPHLLVFALKHLALGICLEYLE